MGPNGVIGLVTLPDEAVKLSGEVEPLLPSSKLRLLVSTVRKLDDSEEHDSECGNDPYLSYSRSSLWRKSMVRSMQAPSKLWESMAKLCHTIICGWWLVIAGTLKLVLMQYQDGTATLMGCCSLGPML